MKVPLEQFKSHPLFRMTDIFLLENMYMLDLHFVLEINLKNHK